MSRETTPPPRRPAPGTGLFRTPPWSVTAAVAGPAGGHRSLRAARVTAAGVVLLGAVFTVVGLFLTVGPVAGFVTETDVSITGWFAGGRSGPGDAVSALGSRIGDTVPVVGVAAAVGLVYLIRRDGRPLALLVVGLGAELAVFLAVNELVDRPRPDVARLGSAPSTGSFPSGHAAATTVLYVGAALVVGRERGNHRRLGPLVAVSLVVPALVGGSRVYRGMHHLSDVVAGWVLGACCLALALQAVRSACSAGSSRPSRPPLTLPTGPRPAPPAPGPEEPSPSDRSTRGADRPGPRPDRRRRAGPSPPGPGGPG